MPKVEIAIPEDLVNELDDSFFYGPMINDMGRRKLDEEQVDRIKGMVIVIQGDERSPPHFHVRFNGESASFYITDGTRLPKMRGLEKFDHNIRKWWKGNYCKLILFWNKTRPSDCQVGPVEVPEECLPKAV